MSILGYALLIGFGLALIGGVVYLVMRYSHIRLAAWRKDRKRRSAPAA
ncbi:MAG: hypothetical protein R3F11_17035 [Verrucomicrobiales bacterium]